MTAFITFTNSEGLEYTISTIQNDEIINFYGPVLDCANEINQICSDRKIMLKVFNEGLTNILNKGDPHPKIINYRIKQIHKEFSQDKYEQTIISLSKLKDECTKLIDKAQIILDTIPKPTSRSYWRDVMINWGLAYSNNTSDPRGLLMFIIDRFSLLRNIISEIMVSERTVLNTIYEHKDNNELLNKINSMLINLYKTYKKAEYSETVWNETAKWGNSRKF